MIKKVESLTGSLSMPRGSVMNDYEKLINKPLVFDSSANFPPTGNAERLYIATNVNKIYYWTGVAYADISGSGGGGSGTSGKSPYIGENGNWFEYNDVLQAWTDTGVKAEGKDGKDGVNGLDGINGIDGIDGTNGIDGIDGKSAYEIAVENGFIGAEIEWLASLKGAKGADGAKGDKGDKGDTGANGTDGTNGIDGTDGSDGADGKSAYQVWLDNGNTGTELEFLASLKGLQGDKGEDGLDGTNGKDGANGIDGVDGKSAYEIAVENGFVGTEAEWLASLKGAKGDTGQDGKDGINGVDGADGAKGDKGDKGDTGDKGIDGINGEDGYTPVKGTDYFTADDIASLGIASKADTTYVDGLVADINTELATKSTKPTVLTDLSSTTQTVTLTDNTEYRYGTLTSLAITWTTSDIHSAIAFTGGTGVTFSITAGVKLVGTDVTSNVFKPVKGKRYNLGFEFDGINRTMYVSGVE